MQNLALQIYSVRRPAQKDFVGTLTKLAAIGYRNLELAGYIGDMTVRDFKRVMDDLGMRVISGHLDMNIVSSPEHLRVKIEDYREMGATHIGLAYLDQTWRTREGYQRAAAILTRAGEQCKKSGLQFFYHHHDFEFQPIGDTSGMDILLSADPALVQIEVDVYWCAFAGVDPIAFLKKQNARAQLIHIKDMAKDDSRTYETVGDGRLDMPAIFATAREIGAKNLIVEQDECRGDELVSVKRSFDNIAARHWTAQGS